VLDGRRLLLVRPTDAHARPRGRARVAIDHVQAGVGELVLVSDEGNAARQVLDLEQAPVKTVVVGVVDFVAVDGRTSYDHRAGT
jgi:ethanolamine utilization protein EutN